MDASLALLTRKDVPPALSTPVPLRLLILADTLHYDGMKSFFVDYIKAFTQLGVTVTYFDVMCREPNGELFGAQAVDVTAVGNAVLAAGARLIRHCLACPPDVCHNDASVFMRASAYDGLMYAAQTWADLPPRWSEFLEPLRVIFAQHDVMIVSCCLL